MEDERYLTALREALPAGVQDASMRVVDERTEVLRVRNGVLRPPEARRDRGAMITVVDGGVGYAATADLSPSGLRRAASRARDVARATAGRLAIDPALVPVPRRSGAWASPVREAWSALPLAARVAHVEAVAAGLPAHERIVEREVTVMAVDVDAVHVGVGGAVQRQAWWLVSPEIEVITHHAGVTQRRTLGGQHGTSAQGGVEALHALGFFREGARVADEALQLVAAPPCPEGELDLVLAPDQMMLQIHESIGHPLELDRILGDERNYAGRSFVRPEMFGSYRYGSELLDVSFDPSVGGEFASYAFDDDGTPASRVLLIERGVLLRPLGGALSQGRAGLPGTANARASSWNRPTIDRMANLNVEPGDSTLDQVIGGVERGVWMETNLSWSIDDSRNKFQFGCELGREIRDGRLGGVVRNPCYRGVSSAFWRNLAAVGDAATVRALGTPFCGKGEPNQAIRVGHASPVCRFTGVSVFSGAS